MARLTLAQMPPAVASHYLVDWKQLQRWHLLEANLPAGTVVLFREVSPWQRYGRYIVGGCCLILLEMLLIAALLWQRAKRRATEANLAVSDDRFRLAVESGRSVGFEWDIQSGRSSWFGNLQNIFGISSGRYIGRAEDFFSYLQPEDRQRVANAVARARQNREPYTEEFRVVRLDGSVRWISAKGKFYYRDDGAAKRMLGMAADITERKIAEAALSNVSSRLIEVQERERTRIARELHDDIGQRLALLTNGFSPVQREIFSDSHVEAISMIMIGELQYQCLQIANDVQSLSHELHSSKLEYLGLGAAGASFCREFAAQHNLEVDFQVHDMPSRLPEGASLCLFRVLQEALHNSAKYSGVRHAEVRLWGADDDVHLTVSDNGAGFDAAVAREGQGLGLISMEERLKLLGGRLSIITKLKSGTTIHARVPLTSTAESHSQQIASPGEPVPER